jgi:hypothetical protein
MPLLDTTSAIFSFIAVAFITASLFPNLFTWKPKPISEGKRNEIALELIKEEQEKRSLTKVRLLISYSPYHSLSNYDLSVEGTKEKTRQHQGCC